MEIVHESRELKYLRRIITYHLCTYTILMSSFVFGFLLLETRPAAAG